MAFEKFRGIFPALVTPFEKDNKTVNEEATRKLLDLLLNQGADGFYIIGGTGEGLVMAKEERMRMCEVVVDHVSHKKPIINHIAAMNFRESVELAKHAEKSGCEAIAAVPPSFFHYTEDDIFNYYKGLAESVSIPLIIYYHPAAQKDMSAKLISHIFEIDNVSGVKWSSGNYYELLKLKDMTHGEMNIINGPDEMLISGLAAGADAGVGSTYNCMMPQFKQIYTHFVNGETQKALDVQLKVNRVIDLMIKYEVIPAVKHTIGLMGIDVGEATFPMKRYTEAEIAAYDAKLKEIGWPF